MRPSLQGEGTACSTSNVGGIRTAPLLAASIFLDAGNELCCFLTIFSDG
jgi:hypothetical protein